MPDQQSVVNSFPARRKSEMILDLEDG